MTKTHTSRDDLPASIRTYLDAHAAGDDARVLATFTADAVVTDEGRDHDGHDGIRAWLTRVAGEYTYTTEFVSATVDADTADVVQHLDGDFPGGTVDLHYRFSLDGGLIRRLVIEP